MLRSKWFFTLNIIKMNSVYKSHQCVVILLFFVFFFLLQGEDCNEPTDVLQSDTWCGDCNQALNQGYCNSDGTCCCNPGYTGEWDTVSSSYPDVFPPNQY